MRPKLLATGIAVLPVVAVVRVLHLVQRDVLGARRVLR